MILILGLFNLTITESTSYLYNDLTYMLGELLLRVKGILTMLTMLS